MVWKKRERPRIRTVWMDNLRTMIVVSSRTMNKKIKELVAARKREN